MKWQPIETVPKDQLVDMKNVWGEVTLKNKWDERGFWVRGKFDQIWMNPHFQTHWRQS